MPRGPVRSSGRWGRYRWRMWLLMIFGLIVALGLTALSGGRLEEQCTLSTPCHPQPYATTVFALLVAAAFAVPILGQAAGALAIAAAAAWLAGLGLGQMSPPAWLTALAVGYAVAFGWLTLRRPRPGPSVLDGPTAPAPARVPVARGPRLPWMGTSVAAVAVAGCAVLLTWTVRHQSELDAEERAATVVVADVVGHDLDANTITVKLPDGRLSTVHSVRPEAYPPAATASIYVDDRGLAQLTLEPYDISGLVFVAVLVGCLALAYALRRFGAYRDALAFVRAPQQVYDVRVTRFDHCVAIYPPGSPDAAPVLVVAVQPGTRNDPPDSARTVVYGHPAIGELVGIDDRGDLLLGISPARRPTRRVLRRLQRRERTLAAAPTEPQQPTAVAGDELLPADRDAGPSDVRTHEAALASAVCYTVFLAAWLPSIFYLRHDEHPLWTVLVVTSVVSFLAMELGWRRTGRMSLSWHAGGVTAIGPWRTRKLDWSDPRVANLLAEPRPPRWFRGRSKPTPKSRDQNRPGHLRTDAQRRAALRHSYQQYGQVSPRPADWPSGPPQVSPRRRPYWLILLWPVAVAVAYELGPLVHPR